MPFCYRCDDDITGGMHDAEISVELFSTGHGARVTQTKNGETVLVCSETCEEGLRSSRDFERVLEERTRV